MCVLFLIFNLLIPSVYVYCRNVFFMVNSPFGALDTYTVDYIHNTFGKGALMDSYLMDFVIKYWKQDPAMGLVYHSGECVLLSSLFITVNVCCHSFLLHWLFHVHACLHCLFFFFMSFFLFFLCAVHSSNGNLCGKR